MKRWRVVIVTASIFVLILIVVGCVGYYRTGIPQAAAELNMNNELARSAGLCLTKEDVDKLTGPVRTEPIVAILQEDKFPRIANQIDIKPQDFQDANVQTFKDQVKQLAEFDFTKPLVFPMTYHEANTDRYAQVFLPHWVRGMLRLAGQAIEGRDLQSARTYMVTAAKLTAHANDNHTYSGRNSRNFCEENFQKGVDALMHNHRIDPTILDILSDALKEIDQPDDYKQVVQVENFRLACELDDIAKEGRWGSAMAFATNLDNVFQYGPKMPRFKEACLSRIYQYHAQIAKVIPSDPYDFDGLTKAVLPYSLGMANPDWSTAFATRKGDVHFDRTYFLKTTIAYRNALMQAVEILKTHRDPKLGLPLTGRYSMDTDGKPLRIAHTKDGWVLYTIMDSSDDHGDPERDRIIVLGP